MSKENNVFRIDSNITDPHMIKNSEWGAAVYLTQSKYGKYGNPNYKGTNKEVYINNSSYMHTGRSGGSYGGNTAVNTVYNEYPDVTNQYTSRGNYTYNGYLLEYNTNNKTDKIYMDKVASTTGNIYGIYDMSGGAHEYVMGVFANSDGEKWAGNSGFAGKSTTSGIDVEGLEWPNEKYYEVYKASSGTTINSTTACNGGVCYGHALSETAGWYGDNVGFVSSTSPWFQRGVQYDSGTGAGVFSSTCIDGNVSSRYSTRVVLVPTI